jgi:Mg2+ and Co2+ transporter CorA
MHDKGKVSRSCGSKDVPYVIVRDASSFVISTNQLGDFGKSTVISRLLDEPTMEQLSKTARDIWNVFVHQPQTARCLVFLVFLGGMCDEMSTRYETVVLELVAILGLENNVLSDHFGWTQSQDVIPKLKRILWALEALRIFRDTLTSCLDRVSEAKSEMLMQVNQGPGRRHETLERSAQSYIEEFKKQHVKLSSTLGILQHKIEQISRYRDGISNVSSLEDSQTSLRQDNNIKKLTWITIAYMPLAFATALFAIPPTQNIVRDGLGLSIFVGIIFPLFIFTLIVAQLLDWIVAVFSKVRKSCKHAANNLYRSLSRSKRGSFTRDKRDSGEDNV